MGRGNIGDGIPQAEGAKSNPVWDHYLTVFRALDDDTAAFWGAKNLGQFVNDRTPDNGDPDYAEKLGKLRRDLCCSLDEKFGLAEM